jgi:formylglycine-generating enzyme required for sulfatase activity
MMANTRQSVSWSLEQTCPFREEADWLQPQLPARQLFDLQLVDRAEREQRILDGICVTSWSSEEDDSGHSYPIPTDGFLIEDLLHDLGGFSEVLATCGACPANATGGQGERVAACRGTLDVYPDSRQLDELLWNIIHMRQLEVRVRDAFTPTDPLWYGFWIDSPLKRNQTELMLIILSAAVEVEDNQIFGLAQFVDALRRSLECELPLHTALLPLGHYDFGIYTVFPHCPRCHASAPVERWQASYPTHNYSCQVCGQDYVPDEHQSTERRDFNWERLNLKTQLGSEGYTDFIRRYLSLHGATDTQAQEVLERFQNGPLLRQIVRMQGRRKTTLGRARQRSKQNAPAEPPPPQLRIPLTAEVSLDLVLIPAGEYRMGADATDSPSNATPTHLVQISRSFYMGSVPVTEAQWQAVIQTEVDLATNPRLPVDRANWFDSQEYCEKLCQKYGRVFRLPSEAEWEYACRAGTTTPYAFGETLDEDQANFTPGRSQYPASSNSVSEHDWQRKPTPVGSYPPNGWGIYDMHGNVAEWCEDVWHDSYEGAPTDGCAWLEGENKTAFRVIRGGWSIADKAACTSDARHYLRVDTGGMNEPPEDDELLTEILGIMNLPCGFRVVCEV